MSSMQHLIKVSPPSESQKYCQYVLGNICAFSTDMCSSNVVELSIESGDDATRKMIIDEMLSNGDLDKIIQSRYGKYVLHKALLMTTGHYVPLIESVSLTYWQSNPEIFAIYACLAAGFIAGLLCFAKLITLLLKKWRAATFHAVAGLALGSVVTMFFNPEVYAEYLSWAAGERFSPDLLFGAALFIVGIVVAYIFVRIQRKKSLPLKNQ